MWRLDGEQKPAPCDAGGVAAPGLAGVLADLHARSHLFDSTLPLLISRAPGRLDVMGGFADYSGSLVLEYPLQQATWVMAQSSVPSPLGRPPRLLIESSGPGLAPPGEAASVLDEPRVAVSLEALTPAAGPLEYAAARRLLTTEPRRAWAAYVAGALVVLQRECGCRLPANRDLRMLIHSNLPTGAGLSSSAAVEVAALKVLVALTGATVDERRLALLAQMVENLVVGAPCGVMDQLTVTVGRHDHLAEILCQPAEVQGHIPLPPHLQLWALGSGVRHAVTGDDYATVRAAAFMGYQIIAGLAGLTSALDAQSGRTAVVDPLFGGYLANVTAARWNDRYRDQVPMQLDGGRFLAAYGGSPDVVTRIDPGRSYRVRACTAHPILEHERARRFAELLRAGGRTAGDRAELGALMYASHASYSTCGLGTPQTDRLVELVRARGHARGLHGAKITGGGSGGSVAVLADQGAAAVLDEIASVYQGETGRPCQILSGSSSGAASFGVPSLLPV